ncbi:MAG: hypothetical protein IT290_04130 [Deltaproteobacteria bacterium]|nr:hypothetical protein [Deltaproteobacteria bacterium]
MEHGVVVLEEILEAAEVVHGAQVMTPEARAETRTLGARIPETRNGRRSGRKAIEGNGRIADPRDAPGQPALAPIVEDHVLSAPIAIVRAAVTKRAEERIAEKSETATRKVVTGVQRSAASGRHRVQRRIEVDRNSARSVRKGAQREAAPDPNEAEPVRTRIVVAPRVEEAGQIATESVQSGKLRGQHVVPNRNQNRASNVQSDESSERSALSEDRRTLAISRES